MKYFDLTIEVQLHIDSDVLATTYQSKSINNHLIIHPFSIYINNKYVRRRTDYQIRQHSHKEEAKAPLIKKWGWGKRNNKILDRTLTPNLSFLSPINSNVRFFH